MQYVFPGYKMFDNLYLYTILNINIRPEVSYNVSLNFYSY